jgi:hypothetical protein
MERTRNMFRKRMNKLQRVISQTHTVKELAPLLFQQLSPRADQLRELVHHPQEQDPHRPSPRAPATEALHPSWEAARLRKQREAEGPKATKIVFD